MDPDLNSEHNFTNRITVKAWFLVWVECSKVLGGEILGGDGNFSGGGSYFALLSLDLFSQNKFGLSLKPYINHNIMAY